jgi:Kef-type K+ transport system membrane component KefB
MANKKKTLSRRMTALLWLIVVGALIGTMIYIEQISILYVLTTLALVALLLIVGFSDLESVWRGDEGADSRM